MAGLISRFHKLVPLWAFIIVALAGSYWISLNQQVRVQEQNLAMQQLGSAQVSILEKRMRRALAASYILGQDVIRHHGAVEKFDELAAGIFSYMDEISSLQLAPEGVIGFIYPLKGNEPAIGRSIDQLENKIFGYSPSQNVIQSASAKMIGPMPLVQGGVAMIARNPVFIRDDNGIPHFWGLASAVVTLSEIVNATALESMAAQGYRYRLCYVDIHGKTHPIAQSAVPLNQESYMEFDMDIPGVSWKLKLSHPLPVGALTVLAYMLILLLALITAWVTHRISREPERLRRLVQERTAELKQHAYFDFLTGLANRRLLQDTLQQAIGTHRLSKSRGALLYMDLDDFKRINDSLDHQMGDQLLKTVSERVTSLVGSRGVVARLGGDEFAVLLHDASDAPAISQLADALLQQISQPISLRNRQISVSASIGITLLPDDGDNLVDILRNADLALYEAKKQGKNCYGFFDPVLQHDINNVMQVEEELRLALSDGQFVLHLQPIFCLQSRALKKCEVLIRWQHPERGLLFPGHFIDIAESTGLIIPLGYWVFHAACDKVVERIKADLPAVPLTVNVSANQLKERDLVVQFERILQETGAPAALLELEITESLIMEDMDQAVLLLEQCRKLGLKVAIDDFGTGYSSLAQLKKLPVDTLKVDRSFVQDLTLDHDDRQITAAIIAMAHKLDLDVVAEGIETEEQFEILLNYGCDMGQGYLLGRPVADPFVALDQATPR
ncbi:EAL domain-containing protein [Pokkaliibacter sp. MBI-7]|uniref:bifunctional diguanylate cyclase/phosphodiesterase n=1 Tax=Pokkaliibacter sp. MBI-7 TaxID=3040600 RepID=UPI0024487FC8|nr:EAL domain-containing protein [Pokkaliibacter sp. MBI-7]MDH2433180.1 EAL domain-containing protein [Pokkaliibacter sp. MBI-7]